MKRPIRVILNQIIKNQSERYKHITGREYNENEGWEQVEKTPPHLDPYYDKQAIYICGTLRVCQDILAEL